MRTRLLLSLSLAALVAACGKPAPNQNPPQWPEPQGTPTAVTNPPTPAPPAAPVASEIPADRSTPEQRAETAAAAAQAGLPVTNESRGNWACDNGETIELRFFPDQGVAVLVRGGQNTELQQEVVASGIKYSNGQTTIQGKGDELMLTVGMMAATKCTAVRA